MAVETIDELHTAIGNLIRQASGVNAVILANPDQAPPEGAYGTYRPIPVRAYGQVRRVREEVPALDPAPAFAWTDIEETVITQLELMVSVNFFNAGSQNAALNMLQGQFRQSISNYCFENGLGWRFLSEVRDLTDLEQGEVQSRHQVDLHLWVETSISDTMYAAAGFSVIIEDENGNELTHVDGNIGTD